MAYIYQMGYLDGSFKRIGTFALLLLLILRKGEFQLELHCRLSGWMNCRVLTTDTRLIVLGASLSGDIVSFSRLRGFPNTCGNWARAPLAFHSLILVRDCL